MKNNKLISALFIGSLIATPAMASDIEFNLPSDGSSSIVVDAGGVNVLSITNTGKLISRGYQANDSTGTPVAEIDTSGNIRTLSTTKGTVELLQGTETNSGHIVFNKPDGIRTGYVGRGEADIEYTAETGIHNFTGDVQMNGALVRKRRGEAFTTPALNTGESYTITSFTGLNKEYDAYEVYVNSRNGCGHMALSKLTVIGSNKNNLWRMFFEYARGNGGNNSGIGSSDVASGRPIAVTVPNLGCADQLVNHSFIINVNSSGELILTNNGSNGMAYTLLIDAIDD